ncbi:hypothetical protein [Streptomyces heilongjiangensis]|uniref:Uncharacterized protein n=1 Tax=Streptomyces heilongjiangensis TaxID=945052 RepID=A0ABW1B933_9ACTN|nr:hypothetical protein [Streptomyces heilongjiangensis]MDC2947186.1 hypothetical protein [Streptomyces heilongjiangensis]
MNENIRRSLVLAADATGTWALGAATADADEPHTPTVTASDVSVDPADSIAPDRLPRGLSRRAVPRPTRPPYGTGG